MKSVQVTPFRARYSIPCGENGEDVNFVAFFDSLDEMCHWASHAYAFADCEDINIYTLRANMHYITYVGWQPGMHYQFRDCQTGEIIYDRYYEEWDH